MRVIFGRIVLGTGAFDMLGFSDNDDRRPGNSLLQGYSSSLGEALLRQRARQAERRARIETQLASRIKSEFVSNMSHELRTPLNTLLGFSKLLGEHGNRRLDDADIIQYASLINDAGKHLLAVINDILDISKMQSGSYSLDSQEVFVADLLEDCVERYSTEANDAKVTLTTKFSAKGAVVRGDERKLEQIFQNLLSNAVKFTPEGGTVEVELGDKESRGVTVVVRDTGVGMSEEEIRVALEPFGQVDGAHTRWREGTGLGLPIARALVELHGGEFRLKSEKNVGTEVAMYFPSADQVSLAEVRELVRGTR